MTNGKIDSLMTDRELVLAWLARIGEDDPVCIAACLRQCETDKGARAYYVGLARALPEQEKPDQHISREIAIHNPDPLPKKQKEKFATMPEQRFYTAVKVEKDMK